MARRRSHRRRSHRGGSFQTRGDSVSPGNLIIHPTTGPQKDCYADQPLHRDGYIDPTSYSQKGLPGMSGGRLQVADSLPYGEASSPAAPVAPALPPPQKGGAYGAVLGPLNSSNGVGSSGIPSIQSIPCAQRYPMRGGGQGADMLSYQAPNAGYTNQAVTFPGGAVPGFMSQVGYPAGSFNRACLTTGGGNAFHAVAPVMNPSSADLGTRKDFDGSSGPLPFRGGRRSHRRRHRHRSRRSHRRRHTRR